MIPVRDNAPGLRRLLMTLRAVRVVVVDDSSEVPVDPGEYQDLPCQVTVLRHERSKGPGAARNTGIAHCDNEFVAFLIPMWYLGRGGWKASSGTSATPTSPLRRPGSSPWVSAAT